MDELRAQLIRLAPVFVASIFAVACNDGQTAATPARGAAFGVVDSILDPTEAAARFVQGVPRVAALEGGASSAEELIEDFFEAIANGDSTAIARMAVSRAEYGFLYYPTSIYTGKPYELAPDIAWLLSSETSLKAARRLVRRLGGQQLNVSGWTCGNVKQEGLNTILSNCSVSLVQDQGRRTRQLFQSLIERDGRVKFLSYAGDL
ncbi:MAG: hypothetical protein ACSLFK_16715 [Gemmatimonadaceae bacterium]